MSYSEYPKVISVDCAICGEAVTIILELMADTPRPMGGLMRVPFYPEPTVLDGCEHFHERESNNARD
jgi:hypothetical protein